MPRKWTREERRKHLFERYRRLPEKIFVTVVCVAILLILLAAMFTSLSGLLSLQLIAAAILCAVIVLFFLLAYEGERVHIALVAGILLLLLVAAAVTLVGMLSGALQFMAAILLGVLFLVAVALAAFLIDMHTWESL